MFGAIVNVGPPTKPVQTTWLRALRDHTGRNRCAGQHSSNPTLSQLLHDSRLVREARRVMSVLFKVSEDRLLCGWRCFLKPSGGDVTPWHQDAAYRPPPHHGGTVWLPLDPATFESGCLEYLPGSHRGPVLEHALHGHHLVTEPIGVDQAISCPLSLGDVSIHNCLTVHRAGTNRTAKSRRAFAVVCQVAPE